MSEIINKFNIFCEFHPNFKENIQSFHVSRDPLLGYFVLNDNKVYGFGERIHEILGYNKSEEKYVLITELCDKNIQEFYEGKDCMFGRNEKNEIFSWGWNYWGQLARGYESGEREYLKPDKIDFFDVKNIIYISCGDYHCFALSSDGLIYGWGFNRNGQVGCGKSEGYCISTPIVIDLNEKVKFIHCSREMSFAVSFDGNAYYWGEIGYKEVIFTPKLIALKNVFKIYNLCSHNLFIILQNNGNVFEFNPKYEEIIELNSNEKFCDLYCDHNYCVFQSEDFVYQLKDIEFIKTDFYNFYEYYSQNSWNYKKTIEIRKEYLMTKEIQTNKNDKNLILVNKMLQNYDTIFENIRELGSGSFGQVVEVKLKCDNQHYAIKKVEMKDEFNLREIQIMSQINSEFVVLYIDSWNKEKLVLNEIKNYLFIQMELCSMNLRDFIQLMNQISDEIFQIFCYFISCELFKELIECVNYLHSLNPPIIHRDLKPENFLISDGINGRFLKLCDFGLAKFHDKSSHTRMAGTMKYMAPEVLVSRNYNMKSDIYSLAIIAQEIFKIEQDSLSEYSQYYSKPQLETKFNSILKIQTKCLTKDYNSRPDSNQLLNSINEWTVDKNTVLMDENLTEFRQTLTKHLILNKFFEKKIEQNMKVSKLIEKQNSKLIFSEIIEEKFNILLILFVIILSFIIYSIFY